MFKKLIAAGATLAVALGIVALATVPAQAHTAGVTTSVQCTGPNQSTITWTIWNDWSTVGKIDSVSGTAVSHLQPGSPLGATIPVKSGNTNGTVVYTQTVTGTASYDLQAHVTWSDYSMTTNDAVASGSSGCTVPATIGTISNTPSQCDTPQHPGQTTQASFIVTGGSHISYTYTLNGGSAQSLTPGTAVPVDVSGGDVAVVVTPTADTGYSLPSYDSSKWSFTLAKVTSDCRSHLTVSGSVTPIAAICVAVGTPGTGEVDFSAGLPLGAKWVYSLTGPTANDYQDAPASLKLTGLTAGTSVYAKIVVTGLGFVIDNTVGIGPFTVTVPSLNASDCVSPADLTIGQKQAVCDTSNPGVVPFGYFTVPTSSSVTYTYNGAVVNGTTQKVTVGDQPLQVTVTATPKTGYYFAGNAASIQLVLNFAAIDHSGCIFDVKVGDPIVQDAVCTGTTPPLGYTEGYYNLTAITGVSYQVSVNGKNGPFDSNPVVGSNVNVAEGTQLWITASVDPTKYNLLGYPAGGWDFTKAFTKKAVDCQTAVKVAVSETDQTCAQDSKGYAVFTDGSITVTAVPHATYTISSVGAVNTTGKTGAVTTAVAPGTYYVSVAFDLGYKPDPSSNYPDGGWKVVVNPAQVCGQLHTQALVTPAFTPHAAGCFSQGSYTLSSDQDAIDPNAVIWTVNGSTVAAGTYPIGAGQTVRVTAAPNLADDYGFASGTTNSWTYTAPSSTGTIGTTSTTTTAALGACDLTTLALTGVGNASVFFGIGYLAVIAGLSLIAVAVILRRRSTNQ